MTNWEHQRPPRTSSRWQAPGIFLNVEFGVSFSPDDRTHSTGIKYTSRRMEERLHAERLRRQHEAGYSPQQPGELQQLATLGALMPGPGEPVEAGYSYQEERQTRYQQQQRQRRLGVRTREQHERGTSAPPSLTDRNQPISPVTVNYIPHIAPIQHTQSMPLERTDSQRLSVDRTNQPLPPTPSQFRLGEESMPWSNPTWYRSPEQPAFTSSTTSARDQEIRRIEDPQRVRELETLHQAMMTVDSLDHEGWEPWSRNSVGDIPRGPRSIGWAVSSRDAPPGSLPVPAPPPYVVSQWEQAYGRSYVRPKSAHS